TVFTGRDRTGTNHPVVAQGTSVLGGTPLAVLVNESSASASELIAAVEQSTNHARVIGQKTAGAVNGANFFPVAGGALEVTVEKIYIGMPEKDLDGVGVTPDDIVIPDPQA